MGESLKVCNNDRFIIVKLCWTLSTGLYLINITCIFRQLVVIISILTSVVSGNGQERCNTRLEC